MYYQYRIHEKLFIPGVQSGLGKSIKLLLSDASSHWPGKSFSVQYYVWRFLCQNFIGLCQIFCPQHQFEVKEAFSV